MNDNERIEGTYYAVVETELEEMDFPVVKFDGVPAIFESEDTAKERRDGLTEVHGDRFEVIRLTVERYQDTGSDRS